MDESNSKELIDMNRCEFCGAPLDPEEKKCPYCGTAVPKTEKAKPTPIPSSSPDSSATRRPPLGTTAPPPLWDNSSTYRPSSAAQRRTKRSAGCLIAFVFIFILIVFFSVFRTITGGAFSIIEDFFDDDFTPSYSYTDDDFSDDELLAEKYVGWYPPGMYKVGTDLAAGVYRADALDGDGYFAVYSDSSGKSDSILFNDIFDGYAYFVLKEGQYLKLSRCAALESEKVPAEQPEDGVFTDGTFRIGIDIPAGEYKITASGSDSYYCLMGSAQCAYEDQQYIASDYVENSVYLTLEDGQFLTLEDGAALTVEETFPQT